MTGRTSGELELEWQLQLRMMSRECKNVDIGMEHQVRSGICSIGHLHAFKPHNKLIINCSLALYSKLPSKRRHCKASNAGHCCFSIFPESCCQALRPDFRSFLSCNNIDYPAFGLPIGTEMRRFLVARPVAYHSFSSHAPKTQRLALAYHRHESPSRPSVGPPIILMHGLFGSRRNNRTMSK